jgi:hypothetical protein
VVEEGLVIEEVDEEGLVIEDEVADEAAAVIADGVEEEVGVGAVMSGLEEPLLSRGRKSPSTDLVQLHFIMRFGFSMGLSTHPLGRSKSNNKKYCIATHARPTSALPSWTPQSLDSCVISFGCSTIYISL